jgi:endonuclease YncB( thermonuclease family)
MYPELAKLEDTARAAKIGLWSQPNTLAPWNYRHKK